VVHEFRADIHCHTSCSDGSVAPLDLLKLASEAKIQGLSVTDHDTADAYTPEFFSLAKELQIRVLTGIEISTQLDGASIHILGYGFDLGALSLFLKEAQARRNERNRLILEQLRLRNMPISMDELQGKSIGRPHIAALMVQKGYVGSIQEAFFKYLKEGASCYVAALRFTPENAIEEIHKARGKAVLAHPHFIRKGTLLKKLLSLPFDGIECYYACLPKQMEIPWLKIAKERDLIATGGSDFHGSIRPQIPLGASWVNLSTFEKLVGL
jgi:predicted metal-dependent phosphoesterase TrpH